MIKINTGKGKLLSFDIDIEGGNSNEIKEGRFIIFCPNKNYKLMFNAIIENNNIMVDLPPLDINESSGKCSLEMISQDNQYYSIWEDNIKFDRELTIKVKEQKDISDKKPTVTLNEGKSKINKEIVKSSETVTLYRTIKSDLKTINKILSENKFSMKPKGGLNVRFYKGDSQLINDLENIDYGVSIFMNINDGIIEEDKNSIVVDSSYLENINEKNVLFLIVNGKIVQLKNKNE